MNVDEDDGIPCLSFMPEGKREVEDIGSVVVRSLGSWDADSDAHRKSVSVLIGKQS
jgi:hypothetical protein